MIHVRRLLFVTIFTGLLAGCAAFEKADKVVMSGQAESAVFNIEYTQIEQQIIKHAISEYHKFHEDWKDFIGNPVTLTAIGNEKLMEDYANLRHRYFEIEQIIAMNFDRYDNPTRDRLLEYQEMAMAVDRSMDRVRTVSDVATYGALVAQIAAKML